MSIMSTFQSRFEKYLTNQEVGNQSKDLDVEAITEFIANDNDMFNDISIEEKVDIALDYYKELLLEKIKSFTVTADLMDAIDELGDKISDEINGLSDTDVDELRTQLHHLADRVSRRMEY